MAENIGKEKTGARPNLWLSEFASNTTSQYGENGMIAKVLDVTGNKSGWCVELGSWDGKKCSNTYPLITEKGYSAVLIEADKRRFKNLVETFEDNKHVVLVNAFVGFDQEDSLDRILKTTDIPKDFDLLSIDIDGNDYYLWKAMDDYRPKVVIIEFNPTIPNAAEFVQPCDRRISWGSSLLSIAKLAKSKGYELIATTEINAIYVERRFFDLFGIKDNSVKTMRPDEPFVTHVFCGYDGTIFIRGYGKSPWQTIPLRESKMQILPGWARKRIGDRNVLRRKFGTIFRRLRKKGLV